jgi:hypothetical protein
LGRCVGITSFAEFRRVIGSIPTLAADWRPWATTQSREL